MSIVRLLPADAEHLLAFRVSAFAESPASFRTTRADDEAFGLDAWRTRLARDFVVASSAGDDWSGVGGFSRLEGRLLNHKGLIWGMYVCPVARGSGTADAILRTLLDHAAGVVRQVQLTVMAENVTAIRFYERHGFEPFGLEVKSVRQGASFADELLMWRFVSDTA